MIRDWDVNEVISQCQRMWSGANDPYVTGWNNWPCKQDLYLVKFAVDDMLRRTPSFSGEEQWLDEQKLQQEKTQVWQALNEVQKLR